MPERQATPMRPACPDCHAKPGMDHATLCGVYDGPPLEQVASDNRHFIEDPAVVRTWARSQLEPDQKAAGYVAAVRVKAGSSIADYLLHVDDGWHLGTRHTGGTF